MCGRVARGLAVGVTTLQYGLHFIPNVTVITFLLFFIIFIL